MAALEGSLSRGIAVLLLFLPLSARAMAVYEPMSGLDALAMIEKTENDCGQVGLKDLRIATPIFRKYHPMIAQQRLMTAAWSCQQELALTNMKLTHATVDEERRGLQRLLWSLETKRDFLRQQANLAN